MRISPVLVEHLDAIYNLECECYSDPWSKKTFRQEIDNPHVVGFVALDPIPVGYTFMRLTMDEGHIENIAVSPDCRKRGIASLLMDALLVEANNRNLIGLTLEVRQGNRKAMALYHKYGFIVSGYRRDYYRDPYEDAVIMWKHLSNDGNINIFSL
jgi:ribosomal-protein-alanine N-acetyltransferase